jgi:hypothetical protein
LTDDTYETESHHTPESRDRDARMVGHEAKADTSREAVDQLWKELVFETVNGEIDKLLAGNIITMLRAIAAERDALEAENKRLREAAKPFDDAARDRAAEAPEWCVNDALAIWVKIGDLRNLRAALKGDSHD